MSFIQAAASVVKRADLSLSGPTSAATNTPLATSNTPMASNLAALPTNLIMADLPSLSELPALETASFTTPVIVTTPVIEVQNLRGNPFIATTNFPRGTVFIGFGSGFAAILALFGLYHLFKSLIASTVAMKTANSEKRVYQQFADNAMKRENNWALAGLGNYQGAGTKLSLFQEVTGSNNVDSNSSFYEQMAPTKHQDFTNMFISPTKEVMAGKSRSLVDSQINMSTLGYGKNGFNPARSSQHVQSMYFHDTLSTSSVAASTRTPERYKRRNVPSMFLEDLVNDK